jgi:hypothetical protein
MFVVMNANGSPLVGIDARIGAEIPALGKIGWGALVVGSLITVGAVRLLIVGLRQPDDVPVPYRQPQGEWSPHR